MVSLKNTLASLVVASAAILPMTFQPVQAQGVLEACEEEIEALCSKVAPGDGRLIACMYAHENYLGEGCAMAIVDLGDMIDFLLSNVRQAAAICSADIEAQCKGTEFGHGRILSCLVENQSDVSAECNQAVDMIRSGLAE